MMQFTGDNINLPTSIPNETLNTMSQSISAPLNNNLQLNGSIPNKQNINLTNNLRGAYMNSNNISNFPNAANNIGIPNLSLNNNNNQLSGLNANQNNQLLLNLNNNFNANLTGTGLSGLNGYANSQLNLKNGLNLGGIAYNQLNSIPQELNASLLPQPIAIKFDKNSYLNNGSNPTQAQREAIVMGIYYFQILFMI